LIWEVFESIAVFMGSIAPEGTAADNVFEFFGGDSDSDQGFNKMLAQYDPTGGKKAVGPPSPEEANRAGLKDAKREAKLRASKTLFTGGQGLTESPATASTVLLGM
jgi:hypothetical protein